MIKIKTIYGSILKIVDADDLRWADLCGADLRRADLFGANLRGAYMRGADLSGADLRSADMCWAKLCWANLKGADLREADLDGAKLPHFQIPDGSLTVWKKAGGKLIRLRIPPTAKRTASLIGRKCRAEFAYVEWIESSEELTSNYDENTKYITNSWVYPDSYDDDIRIECSHGIHFFLTRAEAEEWQL